MTLHERLILTSIFIQLQIQLVQMMQLFNNPKLKKLDIDDKFYLFTIMIPCFSRSGTCALVIRNTLWHLAKPSLFAYRCPLPTCLYNLREPSSNGCRRLCMASSTFLAFVINELWYNSVTLKSNIDDFIS